MSAKQSHVRIQPRSQGLSSYRLGRATNCLITEDPSLVSSIVKVARDQTNKGLSSLVPGGKMWIRDPGSEVGPYRDVRLYYVPRFLLYSLGYFPTSLSTDQIILFYFDFRIYALLQQWLLSSVSFSSAGHLFSLSILHFPCVESK